MSSFFSSGAIANAKRPTNTFNAISVKGTFNSIDHLQTSFSISSIVMMRFFLTKLHSDTNFFPRSIVDDITHIRFT